MAKAIYTGVDGVAKKVTKMYVGVDGVARRVKKAYIGVGGVARPCFSLSNGPQKYGTITNTTHGAICCSSASLDNHALLWTFEDGDSARSYIEAHDANLTKTVVTATPYEAVGICYNAGAAAGGTKAYFGGGVNYDDHTSIRHSIMSIDDSLTVTSYFGDLNDNAFGHLTESVGIYAFFANGLLDFNDATARGGIEAINTSGTTQRWIGITSGWNTYSLRENNASTHNDKYAIFSLAWQNLWAIDAISLTKTNLYSDANSSYTQSAISCGAGASVGGLAIMANRYTAIAFDDSLTMTVIQNFDTPAYNMGATSVGDYAMFTGGCTTNPTASYVKRVRLLDASLTQSIGEDMVYSRYRHNMETVGDYVIISGRSDSDWYGYPEVYKTN